MKEVWLQLQTLVLMDLRFLPIIIKACIRNKKFSCSEGIQYRDFVHVNDVVDGALKKITAAGKTAGTLASENTLPHYIDVGARFFSFSWLPWLSDGAEGILKTVQASN